MHVDFKSIQLINFRSVANSTMFFKSGVNLIVGDNQVEINADSNGAGKSTYFVYAPTYLFFSKYKTPEGKIKKTGFTRKGCNHCEVKGVISINGGSDITIRRGRRRGKPFLKIENSPTPIAGNQDLSYLIGCSFESFISQFVLTRASLESSLFYGTDIKRKDFFLSIAGIDKMINSAAEFCKNEKAKYSLEALELNTILNIECRYDTIGNSLAEKQQKLIQLTDQFNACKKLVDNYQEAFSELTDKLVQTQALLEQKERELVQCLEIDIQFKKLSDMYERRGSLSESVKHLQKEYVDRENHIKQIQSLAGGTCLSCDQFVPKEHTRNVVVGLSETLKSIKNMVIASNSERERIDSDIRETEKLKNELNQKLLAVRNKISNYKELVGAVQNNLAQLTFQKDTSISQMKDIQKEYNIVSTQIDNLQIVHKIQQNRISSLREVSNCFSRFETACANWLSYLKQKLPAYALKHIVSYMSSFAARCLRSLWDTRVSAEIEFDTNTEKLKISIKDINGRQIEIEELSTGEQGRVFLSLAIGSIMATRSYKGWSCNLLVLDEVMDGLDKLGREVMVQLLNELAVHSNLSINIITHHSEVFNFEGDIYRVVKDNEGSRLVVL